MANLNKITAVTLYVGYADEASVISCFQCKNLLDTEGVKYNLCFYPENKEYPAVLGAFSSWVYDLDYQTYNFTGFPLVMWQEVYDNYDTIQCVAQNVDELKVSRLVANKALIV